MSGHLTVISGHVLTPSGPVAYRFQVGARFKVGALECNIGARINDHETNEFDVWSRSLNVGELECDIGLGHLLTPSGHTDLMSGHVLTLCD